MRVYTLIAQRRCSYPGEHAPEVIEACDEWTWDEDPMGYLAEKEREARETDEFTHMRVFITEIDDSYIEFHLGPIEVPEIDADTVAADTPPLR